MLRSSFRKKICKEIVNNTSKRFVFTYPCPRKLREIMKLSVIEREPTEQVINIWKTYHADREANVATALYKNEYNALINNAQTSPMFIFPVKRKSGHFTLLSQYQSKSYLFTYLEDYKLKGANANPMLILTFFDELLFSKGVSLVRGDIVDFSLQKAEAQFLMDLSLRFWLSPEIYENFVYKFNHDTNNFDYGQYQKIFEIN